MTSGMLIQGMLPLNLKKKLALAFRSIGWSYAIFWSISDRQPGILEWGDGYYNGDIKTRKTLHSTDVNVDQMDIERSEQLRELYESLAAGEANPHARRSSTALSPEDLTDTEWYYLVCMSFVFNIGQGLPGRTFADGRPFWLCNAHFADSKVFTRSLLAKSASIQTVVCFPFLGGVLELGVTDLVLEDPDIIEHIKTSHLDIPYPTASNNSHSVTGNTRYQSINDEIFDMTFIPVIGGEELGMASPNSRYRFEPETMVDDSVLVDGLTGASQVQSWQFMVDKNSSCPHDSMDSSDSISQTSMDPENVVSVPNNEKIDNHNMPDLQECIKVNLQSEEVHYQSVLSSVLKSSHTLLLGPHFQISNKESSFILWKKGGLANCQKLRDGNPQRLLKKVLFEVPRKHLNSLLMSPDDGGNKDVIGLPEADEIGANHEFSDPRRKAKLGERYLVLKSIIPSARKIDKVSILDNTIEYLKELEERVQELESCQELTDEIRKRKSRDDVERTSDNNYVKKKTANAKKPLISKRKACDTGICVAKDDNLTITVNNKDVLIEMKCTWRDGILLEILDAISSMDLDSHSVQTVNTDGILSLTIKSKFKGLNVSSAATIKLAIQRITKNS